jgi:hypothetical protein
MAGRLETAYTRGQSHPGDARVARESAEMDRSHRSALLILIGVLLPLVSATAQESGWRTWRNPDLGVSIARPPDLYEVDPESPANDIEAEVEWGPADHGWTILVTSQKPRAARTLDQVAERLREQQPDAEIAQGKIGDGTAALRIVLRDSDSLSSLVYFFNRAGTHLVAVELAISLSDEEKEKTDLDEIKAAHGGTLALFERILASVRLER